MLDRALSINWYDLAADKRDAYLSWLHGSYLPKLVKQAGIMWAAHYAVHKYDIPARIHHTQEKSVPTGNDYILILGAESSHIFSRSISSFTQPGAKADAAELTAQDGDMLALRSNARTSLMTEEARIDGPDIKVRPDGTAPAPCIQLGSFNGNNQAAEDELLAWYAQWRMPALSKLPGCVGMRKMVSVSGWASHGVMYEFKSFDARAEVIKQMSAQYPDMMAWTERFIPTLTHAPGSPHIGLRLWPQVTG